MPFVWWGGCSNSSDSPVLTPVVAPTGGNPSGTGVGATYGQKLSFSSTSGESYSCYITSEAGGNYLTFFNNNGEKSWEWGTFSAFQNGVSYPESHVGKVAKLKGTWTGDDGFMDASRALSKTHSYNGSEWVEASVPNWKTITITLGRFSLSVD